ncbi:MAG: CAP domain-containing protein [Bacteroidetes bacterium]|nr:CAP domain-containing protein [Bacteroidota bacterium]
MSVKIYFALIAGLLFFQSHTVKINEPSPKKTIEEDILYYVNQDRKSKGLQPLKLNDVESSFATEHSRNMATGKVAFGHDGLTARAKKIQKQLGGITAVGENVASGQMTAKEAVEGWLQSPGHKRNIEGDFTLTGIGWAKDKKGMIYFTQIFTK